MFVFKDCIIKDFVPIAIADMAFWLDEVAKFVNDCAIIVFEMTVWQLWVFFDERKICLGVDLVLTHYVALAEVCKRKKFWDFSLSRKLLLLENDLSLLVNHITICVNKISPSIDLSSLPIPKFTAA